MDKYTPILTKFNLTDAARFFSQNTEGVVKLKFIQF